MTKEDKNLLLKDLYARLPYGVKIQRDNVYDADAKVVETLDLFLMLDDIKYGAIERLHIKPYVRPMSSMTDEESNKLGDVVFNFANGETYYTDKQIDWLNEHHFDYRGLIEKGLALEAPMDMYEIG